MEVLVTGGTGFLGKVLVPILSSAGHNVRVMTRQNRPKLPASVSAIAGDLLTGDGLAAAMTDVEVVVHAASSAFRRTKATDVGGAKLVIEHAARLSDPPHIVFPSIVGIDDHPLPYYQAKLEAERLLGTSGIPHSIMRGTQFHVLMAFAFSKALRLPVAPIVKGWLIQPVDESEFASALADLVVAEPGGRVSDFAGPQVLSMGEMAEEYLSHGGRSVRLIGMPAVGGILKAYAAGNNTNPEAARGNVTWSQWLDRSR